jgi:hypothetical protein
VSIAELSTQPFALVRLAEADAVTAACAVSHVFSPVLSIDFERWRKIGRDHPTREPGGEETLAAKRSLTLTGSEWALPGPVV